MKTTKQIIDSIFPQNNIIEGVIYRINNLCNGETIGTFNSYEQADNAFISLSGRYELISVDKNNGDVTVIEIK
jgi:hypothetical protein